MDSKSESLLSVSGLECDGMSLSLSLSVRVSIAAAAK